MKQHITNKQWGELKAKQKTEFNDSLEDFDTSKMPDIGQMIEFLGEHWYVRLFRGFSVLQDPRVDKNYKGELCDALWEAVKHKLKKKKPAGIFTVGEMNKVFKCDICEEEIKGTGVLTPSTKKPRQMCRKCGDRWFHGMSDTPRELNGEFGIGKGDSQLKTIK